MTERSWTLSAPALLSWIEGFSEVTPEISKRMKTEKSWNWRLKILLAENLISFGLRKKSGYEKGLKREEPETKVG